MGWIRDFAHRVEHVAILYCKKGLYYIPYAFIPNTSMAIKKHPE